jgi:hypothetical protein
MANLPIIPLRSRPQAQPDLPFDAGASQVSPPAPQSGPDAPTTTPPAAPPEEQPRRQRQRTATPPQLPRNAAPAPDTDDEVVPPEPLTPDGEFLARVTRIQHWRDAEGRPALDKDGNKRPPTLFFTIDDPAQAKLAAAGKDSCFGYEVDLRLQFTGNFARDTHRLLSGLGCPPASWPKGKPEHGGRPTVSQLCDYLLEQTRGKRFIVKCKAEAGKGENKGRVFCRLKDVRPASGGKLPPQRPDGGGA